jgi:fumarate hydratase class II
MPVIAYNMQQSIRLLADAIASFDKNCARGIRPDEAVIAKHLEESLMLVTALTPKIGYDKAAEIAKRAHAEAPRPVTPRQAGSEKIHKVFDFPRPGYWRSLILRAMPNAIIPPHDVV